MANVNLKPGKRILLIDGSMELAGIGGKINHTLHALAKETLENMHYEIQETVLEHGYDAQKELEKLLWADCWIYQMPGWWMSEPWIVKKYIDEVYILGRDKLYAHDGRVLGQPEKKYGTGGLSQEKTYMFSSTWNAPREAFDEPHEFFEGLGIDGLWIHLHKAHQFLGMSALPSFICNNVVKDHQIELFKKNYQEHLKKVFS